MLCATHNLNNVRGQPIRLMDPLVPIATLIHRLPFSRFCSAILYQIEMGPWPGLPIRLLVISEAGGVSHARAMPTPLPFSNTSTRASMSPMLRVTHVFFFLPEKNCGASNLSYLRLPCLLHLDLDDEYDFSSLPGPGPDARGRGRGDARTKRGQRRLQRVRSCATWPGRL